MNKESTAGERSKNEEEDILTEEHLERFIAFREKMKDRKEVLPKPTDMSVEEAFEKVFAQYKGTFKELSER